MSNATCPHTFDQHLTSPHTHRTSRQQSATSPQLPQDQQPLVCHTISPPYRRPPHHRRPQAAYYTTHHQQPPTPVTSHVRRPTNDPSGPPAPAVSTSALCHTLHTDILRPKHHRTSPTYFCLPRPSMHHTTPQRITSHIHPHSATLCISHHYPPTTPHHLHPRSSTPSCSHLQLRIVPSPPPHTRQPRHCTVPPGYRLHPVSRPTLRCSSPAPAPLPNPPLHHPSHQPTTSFPHVHCT